MRDVAVLGATVAVTLLLFCGKATSFPGPPSGPIYFQFNIAEQDSPDNNLTGPNNASPYPAINTPGTEGNWGIVEISEIQRGIVSSPAGSDIRGGGPALFVNGQNGGQQILGIFFGVHLSFNSDTNALDTGGVLDLYGFNSNTQIIGAELASDVNLAKRTAQNEYTGFTCATGNTANCTFLARLDFVYGSNGSSDTASTVVDFIDPTTFTGQSASYLSVDTGKVGAWTLAFDSNFFTVDPFDNPLPNTPDVRLETDFDYSAGSAWDFGNDVFGVGAYDPARAYFATVPEPASFGLLGIALLGFGWLTRRRAVGPQNRVFAGHW